MKKSQRRKLPDKKSKFREYAEAIIIAALLALMIRTFVVQAFKIPSGSMKETLTVGDHILVNKFLYGLKIPFTESRYFSLRQPRRGDIIVFSFPENREKEECISLMSNIMSRLGNVVEHKNPFYLLKDDCRDFIKRVIGVGGDLIEIRDKAVYINDRPLDEPYVVYRDARTIEDTLEPRDNLGPITIPRGSFFVMGDNRDQSYDSRFWGFVDMTDIKGKAFIIYWSWNSRDSWIRKVRWGRLGHLIH